MNRDQRMAKPETLEDLKPADAPPETFDLTVDEFCTRTSSTDRRVELLAGFRADEVRNGRIKDSEANFASRFLAFAARPA